MKTAKEFFLENRNIKIPEGNIPLTWFIENKVPPAVVCSCCEKSMFLYSAMVDDEGYFYCSNCI